MIFSRPFSSKWRCAVSTYHLITKFTLQRKLHSHLQSTFWSHHVVFKLRFWKINSIEIDTNWNGMKIHIKDHMYVVSYHRNNSWALKYGFACSGICHIALKMNTLNYFTICTYDHIPVMDFTATWHITKLNAPLPTENVRFLWKWKYCSDDTRFTSWDN